MMYKNKLNKLSNLIELLKNDINLPIISDFLEWFCKKLDIHFNVKIKGLDIQKGDIFYVDFGKNIGSELNKNRPCIVYSKKFANKGETIVVIPLRSYKGKINKNLFLLLKPDNENKLSINSIVDITGIRQVSKKRIQGYIGKISRSKLLEIDKKFKKVFGLKDNKE